MKKRLIPTVSCGGFFLVSAQQVFTLCLSATLTCPGQFVFAKFNSHNDFHVQRSTFYESIHTHVQS